MKTNVGTVDKVVRILIAFVMAGLYFTDQVSGVVAIILLILAVTMILTSFMSFCPLYLPFGFSTRKKEK
ncbi:MAG: DUF2892 domain-containing protein [Bacteroidetes bacterium]|nr:DUF2892 domain-containing protein [Bacteroidota bacterium]